MALKLQNKEIQNNLPLNEKEGIVYEYSFVKQTIPHPPIGLPLKHLPSYNYPSYRPIKFPTPPALNMPEGNLPRALNYYADYGGCGFWRMIWPENIINAYQKGCISGLTCMVMDVRFYQNIKSIRFQRQATPVQNLFIKELAKKRDELKYRMIYEVDDVVFRNDIPDYNRCKEAFASSEVEETILDIISSMDEMTVTSHFMKEYYLSKTSCKKITVIPNYAPKFWLGRFYNPDKMSKLFEQQKNRPRILYAGSGTHVDIANKNNMKDDFSHVVQEIIKARKKFKFVWKGTFPLAVKPFIDSGEMELLPWSSLYNLPQDIYNADCIATFAPLADNNFNKSKSNIKIVESGAFGMPGTFQDLCTYKDAELKFNSGTDLINQLEVITKDWTSYSKFSKNIFNFTDKLWLEDHLDEYEAVYFTPWGSQERNLKSPGLISLNLDQKI
jgi:hypothetical protein